MGEHIRDRTFRFAVQVVEYCRDLERSRVTTHILTKQLLRSGTSIGANVEEAQGSQSKVDFIAKMYIATKEARETHYWLRLLSAAKIPVPADILNEAVQLVAILTTIVRKSRGLK